jgi:hypothetical protein
MPLTYGQLKVNILQEASDDRAHSSKKSIVTRELLNCLREKKSIAVPESCNSVMDMMTFLEEHGHMKKNDLSLLEYLLHTTMYTTKEICMAFFAYRSLKLVHEYIDDNGLTATVPRIWVLSSSSDLPPLLRLPEPKPPTQSIPQLLQKLSRYINRSQLKQICMLLKDEYTMDIPTMDDKASEYDCWIKIVRAIYKHLPPARRNGKEIMGIIEHCMACIDSGCCTKAMVQDMHQESFDWDIQSLLEPNLGPDSTTVSHSNPIVPGLT